MAAEPLRDIAKRTGTSAASLHRHKTEHLPVLLVRAEERRQEAHGASLRAQDAAQAGETDAVALDVMEELRGALSRVRLLSDACDRWLRDPADPSRYTLDPRADDVSVIYAEKGSDGRPVQKRAKLSALLARLDDAGVDVQRGEWRHADPRDLVLKTYDRLRDTFELLARLVGDLDERPQITLQTAPEWLEVRGVLLSALGPYPEARAAVAARLVALEAA